MRISDKYNNLLASQGISLAMLGVSDIALKRHDALRAVGFLRTAEIPILGGDVYFRRGERIELAYANWHTEPKLAEALNAYLQRSWDTTETYINTFPDPKDADSLFSIVTGEIPGQWPNQRLDRSNVRKSSS